MDLPTALAPTSQGGSVSAWLRTSAPPIMMIFHASDEALDDGFNDDLLDYAGVEER